MRSNVWVTGANGQLGSEFRALAPEYQQYQFIFTDRESLNITDFSNVMTFVMMNNIEVIVNCAAYTAVDREEKDVELANAANTSSSGQFGLYSCFAKHKSWFTSLQIIYFMAQPKGQIKKPIPQTQK